jgi:cysteine desulfurase
MKSHLIYLDHAASAPVYPEVMEAMLPWLTENCANASSNHLAGWLAKDAVEKARKQVADLIGAYPQEIYFTSGATESINWALKSWSLLFDGPLSIVTQQTEHSAVLSTCDILMNERLGVFKLPVDHSGVIDVSGIPSRLAPNALVAVMAANNETGVLQPLSELCKLRSTHRFQFFCDATQVIGKQKIKVREINCDLLAFSAHKMGGPKGVGVLFISEELLDANFNSFIHGGSQQAGFRAGTLNVPGIIGLGMACELASRFDTTKIAALRDHLENELVKNFKVLINGKSAERVAHISSVQFPGVNSEDLLAKIGSRLAVSSGAACNSVNVQPSHVLKAMGLSDEEAFSTLRFSLGVQTTKEEITTAVQILKEAIS